MPLNNTRSGFANVSEFQASSLPWVITGSTTNTNVIKYAFPFVTKSITVHNVEASTKKLRIGFTENGVNGVGGNYYFVIDSGETVTLDVRVTELYIRADSSNTISHSILAGLTTIDKTMMPLLTGSLDGQAVWAGVG
jgi:hypothetical protein